MKNFIEVETVTYPNASQKNYIPLFSTRLINKNYIIFVDSVEDNLYPDVHSKIVVDAGSDNINIVYKLSQTYYEVKCLLNN